MLGEWIVSGELWSRRGRSLSCVVFRLSFCWFLGVLLSFRLVFGCLGFLVISFFWGFDGIRCGLVLGC